MDELMTPTKTPVSGRPIALRIGLLAGLALVAIGLVFQLTGLSDPTQQYSTGNIISQIVSYGIMGAAIYLAVKQHRDENLGGFISMGSAFGLGMLTILIQAVLLSVWTYIYMEFIDPDMIKEIMDNAMEKAIQDGKMTEEQMEGAQGTFKFFTSPLFISASALIGTVLVGLVLSLIVSLVLKKETRQGVM